VPAMSSCPRASCAGGARARRGAAPGQGSPRAALTSALLAVAAAAGCTDPAETAAYQAPVQVTLTVRAADVMGGRVTATAAIGSQRGNPYAGFLQNTRLRINGEPARIDIERATLELAAPAGELRGLGQVLGGEAEAYLLLDDAAATVAASGTIDEATGDEATLAPVFPDDVPAAQHQRMLSGGFEVGLRGAAAAGFAATEATVTLELTMTFAAYELEAPVEE
jgi:hypothetical protein